MRRFLFSLISLAILVQAGSSALAQGSYRINRGPSQVRSSNQAIPLKGTVEHEDADELVDTSQFATPPRALNGNLNNADNGRLGAGLLDSRLQGRTAAQDTNQIRLTPNISNTRLQGDVSDRELKKLSTHDIIVMQDRSSSMGDKEYFPMFSDKVSRWQWCLSQSMDLTRQASRLPNWGFTLVMFSSQYDVYRNVHLKNLPQLFVRNGIFIGTKLAAPMHEQLTEYFQRRAAGKARPLVIAVITDGKPQDDEDLNDVIIQATRLMKDPNEIRITFLQVGTDDDGQRKLYRLDNRLMSRGARYDIVGVTPFSELAETGLTKALIKAIQG